jgi:hypothetical protein
LEEGSASLKDAPFAVEKFHCEFTLRNLTLDESSSEIPPRGIVRTFDEITGFGVFN